jgi:peptidyl-prolyl cis-trans isomerase C
MTRARFLAALAVAAAIGSAAAQVPPPPAGAPAPGAAPGAPATAAARPVDADPVVAVVNGEPVRASDVLYLYQTLGEGVRQMSFDLLYPQLLQSAVERKIAAQKARQVQVDQRADVKRKFEFWAERVLEETLLNEAVERALTPEALQRAYQDLLTLDAGQEEIAVKHMLFDNPEAAIAIVKELDGGGNFDTILARVTTQGVGRGGPLDYFKRDEIVREFSDAAFRMRPGEYTTTPVRSDFGFHVILVTDRRVAAPPPFETVREMLRQDLGRRLVDEFYMDLMEGAEVQRFNFDGTPMTN